CLPLLSFTPPPHPHTSPLPLPHPLPTSITSRRLSLVTIASTNLRTATSSVASRISCCKRVAAVPAALRSDSKLSVVRFAATTCRSEEHTSELQSLTNLVCRLLLENKTPT